MPRSSPLTRLLIDHILQHPKGFLESKFIEPFAKKYLTFTGQSVLSPALDKKHLPKGLYALILVAVCLFIFSASVDIVNNNRCFLRLNEASLPT